MSNKLIKITSILLCFLLIFEQSGLAQVAGQLDISGYFTQLHSSLTQEKFWPLHLRYLSYDNLNNNFKLLLDKGDYFKIPNPKFQIPNKSQIPIPQTKELEEQTKQLLNYFFVGISLPNESFWVNLRPDSPDNIIDDFLAQTEVGKILLEVDLQLKKDTAQATSPQTPEGKKYWDRLYKKAEELFGSENITIPTLTRPWIVPGEIIIRETQDNAYIYKATLKVMLEEDYLRGTRDEGRWTTTDYSFKDPRLKALNEYSSQLIRELIIPKLTKEVNSSKRYAPLRQVYYSLILSQWFKARFYGKGGLYSWLIDKKALRGLTSASAWHKNTYFKAYQSSFKDGEYNLKEPIQTPFGQSVRSYFSGGVNLDLSLSSNPLQQPGNINNSGPVAKFTAGRNPDITSSPLADKMALVNVGGGNQVDPTDIKVAIASFALRQPDSIGTSIRSSSPLRKQGTAVTQEGLPELYWGAIAEHAEKIIQEAQGTRNIVVNGEMTAKERNTRLNNIFKEAINELAYQLSLITDGDEIEKSQIENTRQDLMRRIENGSEQQHHAIAMAAWVGEEMVNNGNGEFVNVFIPRDAGLLYVIDTVLGRLNGQARTPKLYYISGRNATFGDYYGWARDVAISVAAKKSQSATEFLLNLEAIIKDRMAKEDRFREKIEQIQSEFKKLGIAGFKKVRFIDSGFKTFPLIFAAILHMMNPDIEVQALVQASHQKEFLPELNKHKWVATIRSWINKIKAKLYAVPSLGYSEAAESFLKHPFDDPGPDGIMRVSRPHMQLEAYWVQLCFVLGAIRYYDAINGLVEELVGQGTIPEEARKAAYDMVKKLFPQIWNVNITKLQDYYKEPSNITMNQWVKYINIADLHIKTQTAEKFFNTIVPPDIYKYNTINPPTIKMLDAFHQSQIIKPEFIKFSHTVNLSNYIRAIFFTTLSNALFVAPFLINIIPGYFLGSLGAAIAGSLLLAADGAAGGLSIQIPFSWENALRNPVQSLSRSSFIKLVINNLLPLIVAPDLLSVHVLRNVAQGFKNLMGYGLQPEPLRLRNTIRTDNASASSPVTEPAASPVTEPSAASPVTEPSAASPAQSEEKEGLCVTGDTLLSLAGGRTVTIVEVKVGDYVLSLNEETQAIEPHRINGLLDMGVKPVYKLTTASGRSIKTTANHSYLTQMGWQKIGQLKIGEQIAVPADQKGMYSARNGNSSSWSGKTTNSLLVKSSGDGLLARSRWKAAFIWLMSLGVILRRIIPGWSTSGEWTAKSLSCVTSTPFSEMAKLKTSPLDRPFGERTTSCPTLVRNDRSPRCTFSSSKKRISLLQESRVKFADLQDPSGVMQGYLHMLRCQFGVGVLDFLQRGAGLKHLENQIYHDSRPFKTGLPVADIGISSNIIFDTHINFPPLKLFYHALTGLSSQFCPEAQAAQIPIASGILWDKIVSIEPLGFEHVYDIEVEGTHNFIGNGIFAHNTYINKPGAASPVTEPGASSPADYPGLPAKGSYVPYNDGTQHWFESTDEILKIMKPLQINRAAGEEISSKRAFHMVGANRTLPEFREIDEAIYEEVKSALAADPGLNYLVLSDAAYKKRAMAEAENGAPVWAFYHGTTIQKILKMIFESNGLVKPIDSWIWVIEQPRDAMGYPASIGGTDERDIFGLEFNAVELARIATWNLSRDNGWRTKDSLPLTALTPRNKAKLLTFIEAYYSRTGQPFLDGAKAKIASALGLEIAAFDSCNESTASPANGAASRPSKQSLPLSEGVPPKAGPAQDDQSASSAVENEAFLPTQEERRSQHNASNSLFPQQAQPIELISFPDTYRLEITKKYFFDTIVVGMEDFQWSTGKKPIKTLGASVCAVFVLIDSEAHEVGLGHFLYVPSHSDIGDEELNKPFYRALKEIQDKVTTSSKIYRLYLFGIEAHLYRPEEAIETAIETAKETRDAIIKAFASIGIKDYVDLTSTEKPFRSLEYLVVDLNEKKLWYQYAPSAPWQNTANTNQDSASPASSPRTQQAPGGVDFRGLPIVTQPVGASSAFRDSPLPVSGNSLRRGQSLSNVNLTESWKQIQKMLAAGIIPSSERIREYLAACCQKEDSDKEIDKVLACIADIFRLEEERCQPTDSALKEMLVLLESDKPLSQIPFALSGIRAMPKEAVLAP